MKTVTVTITPWDFDMEVTADIDGGQSRTWDDPGFDPMADIGSVRIGGVNVYDMLNAAQIERIEYHVLRAFDLI